MLPPAVLQALSAEDGSDHVLHCVPADLDAQAHFQNGFLVVTEQCVYTILGAEIAARHERQTGDRFTVHVMTGSGIFLVGDAKGTRVLAYFSRRHAAAHRSLVVLLGASTSIKDQEQQELPSDGLLPVQRGGFARDWVAEPLRSPKAVLQRLLSFLDPYRWTLFISLLLFVVANLFRLLIPQLTRILIDDWLVFHAFEAGPVAFLLGAMAAAYLLHSVVTVLRNRVVARLSSGLVFDLRQAVFASVQLMPMRYIASKPPGDVLNRLAVDTANLRQFLQRWGTDGMSQILFFVLLCALTFFQNWRLALLTIAPIPVAILAAMTVWRLARWMERTHHRLHDKIGSYVLDVISGIRVVKAFRRESAEIARYEELTARKYVVDVRNQKIWRTMGPVVQFSMRLGELLVLLVGGSMVLAGELGVGELVQFAAYVVLLVEPLAWMGELPQRLVEALTSAERIFEAIDQKPDLATPDRPIVRTLRGDVKFENVSFAYRAEEPVLEDFTLDIAAGELIGLVGATGAGKSTVINLLLRLYDVDGGSISIDGVDLRELAPASLRQQVGVVLQDPFLFSGTVAENIRYARPDSSEAQIVQAARIAQVHEFVMGFPDGYDTLVGERGQRLSGGERQRISIARAVLHDPRILILDEATSALDLETEERIHAALAALTKDRTVIAIAHRLATLRRAHRLVVMEAGQVVEMGSHRQLMAADGSYSSMVEAQRTFSEARTLSHA